MTSANRVRSVITLEEIFSQPAVWERTLTDQSLGLERLPRDGEKVLVLGCGTSFFMGDAWAQMRTAAGLGRTRAAIPSELTWIEDDEIVVAVSRSGTTVDVVDALRTLGEHHRVVGVIGTPETPIERLCHERILLDFADERSVVQTRFATTGFLALRHAIRHSPSNLLEDARDALVQPIPLRSEDHFVFLGAGWSVGVAHEAALKIREASGAWVEAYPLREYQHGPIAAASPRTLIWALSPVTADLRDAIAATGARLVEAQRDPLAELIMAQRVAVEMADRAGRDADQPIHLSRSVVTA